MISLCQPRVHSLSPSSLIQRCQREVKPKQLIGKALKPSLIKLDYSQLSSVRPQFHVMRPYIWFILQAGDRPRSMLSHRRRRPRNLRIVATAGARRGVVLEFEIQPSLDQCTSGMVLSRRHLLAIEQNEALNDRYQRIPPNPPPPPPKKNPLFLFWSLEPRADRTSSWFHRSG